VATLADRVVAIDVGGTNLKGAVLDSRGRELTVKRRATGASAGPEAVRDAVLGFACELADGEPAPAAVGLAVPGIVQDSTGTVLMATYAGTGAEDGKMQQAIFRSRDRGASWEHLATLAAPVVKTEHVESVRRSSSARREQFAVLEGDHIDPGADELGVIDDPLL